MVKPRSLVEYQEGHEPPPPPPPVLAIAPGTGATEIATPVASDAAAIRNAVIFIRCSPHV